MFQKMEQALNGKKWWTFLKGGLRFKYQYASNTTPDHLRVLNCSEMGINRSVQFIEHSSSHLIAYIKWSYTKNTYTNK